MIKYLEKEDFKELTSKGTILVDFYADWCGPCKMLGSLLETVDFVDILKVNTDMHPELAREFGVNLGPDATSRANGSVGGEITKRLVERGMSQLSGGNYTK